VRGERAGMNPGALTDSELDEEIEAISRVRSETSRDDPGYDGLNDTLAALIGERHHRRDIREGITPHRPASYPADAS
jgi:hypothetical protein